MDDQDFERRALAAASEHAAWVRRNLTRISADLDAVDAGLRGERPKRGPPEADNPGGRLEVLGRTNRASRSRAQR